MPQASYAVTINRPVADVFAYVANGENCKEWRPGVLDIIRAGGEMIDGVGTRYLQGVKGPMGRRISADYEAHSDGARQLAERYFDSDMVLGGFLEQALE